MLNQKSTRIILTALWGLFAIAVTGQPLNGTTGLMNIPSAMMQKDGAFMAGVNYLPNEVTPGSFDYDTGNYYFNITFLPFFEFSYRMTLMEMDSGNYNQDRSFGMRLRLWRESGFLPALVIGGNDLYSSSGQNATYFNSLYVVTTRNFPLGKSSLELTAGYAHEGFREYHQGNMKGFFFGGSLSPGFCPSLRLMGEYDTQACNIGSSCLFFRHLFLFAMLYDLKIPLGGVAVCF